MLLISAIILNTNLLIHFMFHQLQLVMCLFIYFSILNFDYFIRKVKQIHCKWLLVEHEIEQKKWYREFAFHFSVFKKIITLSFVLYFEYNIVTNFTNLQYIFFPKIILKRVSIMAVTVTAKQIFHHLNFCHLTYPSFTESQFLAIIHPSSSNS